MPMRSPQLWIESLRQTSTLSPASPVPQASVINSNIQSRPMHHSYSEVLLGSHPDPTLNLREILVCSSLRFKPRGIRTIHEREGRNTNRKTHGGSGCTRWWRSVQASPGTRRHRGAGQCGPTRILCCNCIRREVGSCRCLCVRLTVFRLDMLTTLTPRNVKDLRLSGQVISILKV